MDIIELLLKSGADVNLPCPASGQTPLMYAADIGMLSVLKNLLRKELTSSLQISSAIQHAR